jgi:hypothetical protein
MANLNQALIQIKQRIAELQAKAASIESQLKGEPQKPKRGRRRTVNA